MKTLGTPALGLTGMVLGLVLGACFDPIVDPETESSATETPSNEPEIPGGENVPVGDGGVPSDTPVPPDTLLILPDPGAPNIPNDPDDSNPGGGASPTSEGGAEGTPAAGNAWGVVNGVAGTSGISAGKTLYDVEWGGGRFVAVGDKGIILYSADGEAWTAASSGTSAVLRSVVWRASSGGLPGFFIAVGDGGTVLTSPDGAAWTPRTAGSSISFTRVATNGSVAIAVGYVEYCSGFPCTATQPSTPTELPPAMAKAACCVPVYSYSAYLYTSPDGIHWTRRVVAHQPGPSSPSVAIGGGTAGTRFVALGGGGWIATSSDGLNWLTESEVSNPSFLDAAWGSAGSAAGWVAVARTSSDSKPAGVAYASIDGKNWQLQSALGFVPYAVIWTGSRFIVAGTGGGLRILEGSNWTGRNTGVTASLLGLAHRPGTATVPARIVAVGQSGTIVVSD